MTWPCLQKVDNMENVKFNRGEANICSCLSPSERKWELVNFCEFDKYATKSYCAIHNVDESKNLGDITKVDEDELKDFTMICGGSPCQDFSISGKQKGSVWTCKECGHEYNPLTVHWSKRGKCPICDSSNVEKTRSSLLVEYLRVVRAKMPNFGIYENVKNIVGKQFKETFEMFTSELEEYGYNVYYKVLNAKNYGIPQNRERVYLVFIRKDLDNKQFKFPEPFDNGLRLKDLLEDEADEKFYISDEKVKRFITESNKLTSLLYDPCQVKREGKSREYTDYPPTLASRDFKDPRLVNENMLVQLGHINDYNGDANRVYDSRNVARTLKSEAGGGGAKTGLYAVLDNVVKIPQATKKGYIECEIGGVADLSYPDSKTRRGRVQEGGNISPTITATETGVCRIESVKNENSEITLENIRIRKLTPRECFRLMGFSDEAFDAAQTAGISNSQLYKQAGNSIVTDVLYYIYIELYKAMPYLFDNLELSSFFSGIGACECALNRLYQDINSGKFIKK